MKVAVLTREFPPEVYGGAGVHVENLAAQLSARDDIEVAVHCFGAPRPSPLVAGTYRPWDALARGAGAPALQAVSVDLLMAQGIAGADIAHSHTWYANLGGHLAKLLHDIPHVMTTHSLEPLRPWKRQQLGGGYGISLYCERTSILEADAVIAVSEGMRRDVLATYPVDADRVQVIYNGVDPAQYWPDPETAQLTARGIDPGRPSVVFLGRITEQKGILELLDAARWVDPEAQLVLCAASPDTPEIEALVSSAVRELQATRSGVLWIEEALPRSAAVQILSHASVFVCPSRYEPFGLVNIEAMACGAPVVATATGGIPEIVVDGETGLLVAPGTDFERRLAETINMVLGDAKMAKRFAGAGRQRVLERFAWPVIADQTVALYRRVLGTNA
ncbi:MAG: glycogen synthase [Acidimicrobiales bacterium]